MGQDSGSQEVQSPVCGLAQRYLRHVSCSPRAFAAGLPPPSGREGLMAPTSRPARIVAAKKAGRSATSCATPGDYREREDEADEKPKPDHPDPQIEQDATVRRAASCDRTTSASAVRKRSRPSSCTAWPLWPKQESDQSRLFRKRACARRSGQTHLADTGTYLCFRGGPAGGRVRGMVHHCLCADAGIHAALGATMMSVISRRFWQSDHYNWLSGYLAARK